MKRSKLLVVVGDYNNNFWYRNKETFKKNFNVSFVQFFLKGKKVQVPNDIIAVTFPFLWTNPVNKLLNHIYSYYFQIKYLKKNQIDLLCVHVMPEVKSCFLFLYKIFSSPKQKYYLGLCTPLGNSKLLKFILRLNLKLFKYIGGDTPLLRKELHIENRHLFRGNMGYSDSYGFSDRSFDKIRLIYIGTLDNRDIWKTVIGLGEFVKKHSGIECYYDIIGAGKQETVNRLKECIEISGCKEIIKYHGFLSMDKIQEVVANANIGVSFVPIIKMYDGVSITKTVEYLLGGMPVIATSVSFNSGLIKENSGLLCKDTPESFAWALEQLSENMDKYNSEIIRAQYEYLSSEKVLNSVFIPDLESIVTQSNK